MRVRVSVSGLGGDIVPAVSEQHMAGEADVFVLLVMAMLGSLSHKPTSLFSHTIRKHYTLLISNN